MAKTVFHISFQSRYNDKTACPFNCSQCVKAVNSTTTLRADKQPAVSQGPGDKGQADLQLKSQKSSEVDRLIVGANYGENQANLCSPGRWPMENNSEKSKVPAKNFRLRRSNDLWTCKRFWSLTSGGNLWPPDPWVGPSAQRMGKIVFLSDDVEYPSLPVGLFNLF